MKSILFSMSAAVGLFGSLCFADIDGPLACKAKVVSEAEIIQLIAASEALGIQTGPKRVASNIEVFALSENGRESRVNITFAGTVGKSEVVTFKASLNCDAGGVMELEAVASSKAVSSERKATQKEISYLCNGVESMLAAANANASVDMLGCMNGSGFVIKSIPEATVQVIADVNLNNPSGHTKIKCNFVYEGPSFVVENLIQEVQCVTK